MAEGPQAVRSVVAVGAGFFAIQMLTLGAQKFLGTENLPLTLGYMAVIDAIGGYVTARNGEALAFAFISNGRDLWRARAAIDAMGATLASFAR